jgi:hypothetical protein
MIPIDPLQPSFLDDIVGRTEPGPAYGGYGPAPSYKPYHWEMPWIPTPEPEAPRLKEAPYEPPAPPRYEDCAMTQGLFDMLMRDLHG